MIIHTGTTLRDALRISTLRILHVGNHAVYNLCLCHYCMRCHTQVIVQVHIVEHEQLQFEVSSIAKGSNRITGTLTLEHMDVLSPQAVSLRNIDITLSLILCRTT